MERPGDTVTVRFTPMLAEVVPGFRGFVEAMLSAEGVRWPGEVFMCMEGEPIPCGTEAAVMVFPEWFREKAEKHLNLRKKRPFATFFAGIRVDKALISGEIAYITSYYLDLFLPQDADTLRTLMKPLTEQIVRPRFWQVYLMMFSGFVTMLVQALPPGNKGKRARWRLRGLFRVIRENEEGLAEVERALEALGEKPENAGIFRNALKESNLHTAPAPKPEEAPKKLAGERNNLDCDGDDQ
ncbi:MAG TPA: hypothetical protein P5069_00710 [Candidatus Hydrogenedentes bacterium]|nr:hypothetical protein [Candidatus Hydrogenedentota bacterium]